MKNKILKYQEGEWQSSEVAYAITDPAVLGLILRSLDMFFRDGLRWIFSEDFDVAESINITAVLREWKCR